MNHTGELLALITTRNVHLIEPFAAFVVIQLIFAGFYFALYRTRPLNFSFNSDILGQQSRTARLNLAASIANHKEALELLREALALLENGTEPTVEAGRAELRLSGSRRCVFSLYESRRGPTALIGITVFGAKAQELARWKAPSTIIIYSDESIRAALVGMLADETTHNQSDSNRMATLSTATPDIWSYWDFLYFSTIVQTTVGFGDILPNSTFVRLIVSLQIVIGYALLVVVLNIVLTSG